MRKTLLTLSIFSALFSPRLFSAEFQRNNLVSDEVITQSNNEILNTIYDIPVRPVTGTKRVLLVVAKWSDGSTTDPDVQWQQVFSSSPSSLRSFVKNSSQHKLLLEPVKTANGKQMLTPDFGNKPASCGMSDMLTRAKASAAAEGITPADYDYLFVAVKCQGGALANVPGQNIVLFGQGSSSHVWLHEFGHNLGTSHPDMYVNCPTNGDRVETPEKCDVKTIKDPGDPVGGGKSPYPAITRAFAGWFDNSTMAEITKSGRYGISSLGEPGPQLYFIKLPQQNNYMTLEYRKQVSGQSASGGIWVRYSTIGGIVKSTLVNGSPNDASLNNPQLVQGKTLIDADGIIIKVCSINLNSAVVSVAVNGDPVIDCAASVETPMIESPEKNIKVTYKPLFSGTAIPGAEINIVKSHSPGTLLAKTTADSNGSWSVLSSIALPLGKYSVSARQLIGGKHSSWSANQPFVVEDLSLNSPTIVIPGKNDETTPLPIFQGSGALPGAEVFIAKSYHPSFIVASTVADAKGNWQVASSRLPLGRFSVSVRQKFDGKSSAWSENIAFTVESLPVSQTPIFSPQENATTGRMPEVTGTALPGARVIIVKSGSPATVLGSATADANGAWSSKLTTLPLGAYSISARQTFDGKTSSWSVNRKFYVSDK